MNISNHFSQKYHPTQKLCLWVIALIYISISPVFLPAAQQESEQIIDFIKRDATQLKNNNTNILSKLSSLVNTPQISKKDLNSAWIKEKFGNNKTMSLNALIESLKNDKNSIIKAASQLLIREGSDSDIRERLRFLTEEIKLFEKKQFNLDGLTLEILAGFYNNKENIKFITDILQEKKDKVVEMINRELNQKKKSSWENLKKLLTHNNQGIPTLALSYDTIDISLETLIENLRFADCKSIITEMVKKQPQKGPVFIKKALKKKQQNKFRVWRLLYLLIMHKKGPKVDPKLIDANDLTTNHVIDKWRKTLPRRAMQTILSHDKNKERAKVIASELFSQTELQGWEALKWFIIGSDWSDVPLFSPSEITVKAFNPQHVHKAYFTSSDTRNIIERILHSHQNEAAALVETILSDNLLLSLQNIEELLKFLNTAIKTQPPIGKTMLEIAVNGKKGAPLNWSNANVNFDLLHLLMLNPNGPQLTWDSILPLKDLDIPANMIIQKLQDNNFTHKTIVRDIVLQSPPNILENVLNIAFHNVKVTSTTLPHNITWPPSLSATKWNLVALLTNPKYGIIKAKQVIQQVAPGISSTDLNYSKNYNFSSVSWEKFDWEAFEGLAEKSHIATFSTQNYQEIGEKVLPGLRFVNRKPQTSQIHWDQIKNYKIVNFLITKGIIPKQILINVPRSLLKQRISNVARPNSAEADFWRQVQVQEQEPIYYKSFLSYAIVFILAFAIVLYIFKKKGFHNEKSPTKPAKAKTLYKKRRQLRKINNRSTPAPI